MIRRHMMTVLMALVATFAAVTALGISGVLVGGVAVQGKRTLNPCQAKDLRQVVRIPAGLSTSHGDAFLVFDLLQ